MDPKNLSVLQTNLIFYKGLLSCNLGAKHDGQPPTVKFKNRIETCRENEDYIMSPKTTSTPKTGNLNCYLSKFKSLTTFTIWIATRLSDQPHSRRHFPTTLEFVLKTHYHKMSHFDALKI